MFLVLGMMVLSAAGAATFDAHDACELPRKKIKQADSHNTLLGDAAFMQENDQGKLPLHTKILKKLSKNKDKGCTVRELSAEINAFRCGFAAVLEAVVDVMFQNNVDIVYDFQSNSYRLVGPGLPQKSAHCDIYGALAYIIVAEDQSKKISFGKLGYFLFKKGFRAPSYKSFATTYYATCVLCEARPTTFLKRAKTIFDFVQQKKGMPFYQAMRDFRQTHKNYDGWEKTIAKCAYDLEEKTQENIKKVKQEALARDSMLSQETYVLSEREQFMESLLLWDKFPSPGQVHTDDLPCSSQGMLAEGCLTMEDAPEIAWLDSHDGGLPLEEYTLFPGLLDLTNGCVEKEHPINAGKASSDLVVCVAQAMQSGDVRNLSQLEQAMGTKGYQDLSRVTLQDAYKSVRLLCSQSRDREKTLALGFRSFVQKNVWEPNVTFDEQLALYAPRASIGHLRRELQYILAMDDAALRIIQTISIPGLWREMAWDNKAKKPSKTDMFKIKVLDCAKKKEALSYEDCLPYFRKNVSFFEALRCVLDVAIQKRLDCTYHEGERFELAFVEEKKPLVPVPVEVLIAGRFCGNPCTSKDRTIFAHYAYQAGFPMESLSEFFETFDAVCVFLNIDFRSLSRVKKCKAFLEFIQQRSEKKSLSEYRDAYPLKMHIDQQAMAVMRKIYDLKKRDIFAQWGIQDFSCLEQEFSPTTNKNIFLEILKTYAQNGTPCPFQVLALIVGCGEKKTLAYMMDLVFRLNLNIVYDRDRATYMLKQGHNERVIPQEPLITAVYKHVVKNPLCNTADIAYDLYDAGYRKPFDIIAHCHVVTAMGCSCDGLQLINDAKEFTFFALGKMRSGPYAVSHLLGFFHKSHPVLSPKVEQLARSFLQLFLLQELSGIEIQNFFANAKLLWEKGEDLTVRIERKILTGNHKYGVIK